MRIPARAGSKARPGDLGGIQPGRYEYYNLNLVDSRGGGNWAARFAGTSGFRLLARVNRPLMLPTSERVLADALAVLVGDKGLRARMGARGREIAVAEFSEEIVIGQTLAV